VDYRLVKQYLNDAVDNFFKFFYKTVDFGKATIDWLLAFWDIWYNFFMFFINVWLYLYYLVLFFLDKYTMSSSSIAIWRKQYTMVAPRLKKAYNRNTVNPVSGAYGKIAKSAAVSIGTSARTLTKTVTGTISDGASAAAGAAESAAAKTAKTSVNLGKGFSDGAKAFGGFFASIFIAIFNAIKRFFSFIGSHLTPVKEQPVGRRNLIESYMREYEGKKK